MTLVRNIELPPVLDDDALVELAHEVRAFSDAIAHARASAPNAFAATVLVLRRPDEGPLSSPPVPRARLPFAMVPAPTAPARAPTRWELLGDVIRALHEAAVPTLAVLEGAFSPEETALAAACDVVTATPDTRFLQPVDESIDDWTWPEAPEVPALARRVARVFENAELLARTVSEGGRPASWACEIGLVDDLLCPPAITASTAAWARALAQCPPHVRLWLRDRTSDLTDAEGWALLRPDEARESGVSSTCVGPDAVASADNPLAVGRRPAAS